MNAVKIEAAISELAFQPFDAAEFPFAFLAGFGNKNTAIKRLRTRNNNASDVPGGVLQRNNIHIAVCEAGTVGEIPKTLRASLSLTTTKTKAKFIPNIIAIFHEAWGKSNQTTSLPFIDFLRLNG